MSEYNEEVRPKFNVVEPFEGVIMIQMNSAMSKMLQEFIGEFEDLEVELQALRRALNDPRRAYDLRKFKKNESRSPRRYNDDRRYEHQPRNYRYERIDQPQNT